MNYHPNNTASQYTTKLNEVIELDGSWEVRLLEASFPSKVYNVTSNNCYSTMYTGSSGFFEVYLPSRMYTTSQELANALLAAQREACGMSPVDKVFVYFRIQRRRNFLAVKILAQAVNVARMSFSAELAQVLGFDSDEVYSGHIEHKATRPINVKRTENLLYVYCDLLKQVLVRDTKASVKVWCVRK